MNNNEQYRARFLAGLTDAIGLEEVQRVMRVFDEVTAGYDITAKSTALAVIDGLPDHVCSYIASKAVENKSKGTLREYKNILVSFFSAMRKPVEEISTNDIRLYMYKYKEFRNVGDCRIEAIRVVLNNFFEWCVQEGDLDRNPARRIAVIKTPRKERSPMSLRDLEKIRVACKDKREKALVDFLYSTGCRASEAADVLLEDVDMENGTARIRHGKGDKERTVYINAECAISLQAYLDGRNDETPYLFVESRRPYRKISIHSMDKIIRKIVERTDVRVHVTPHVFRHTTATVAIQHGMPVEQVQRMLGHESLDTTMIYAKTDNSQVKLNHERYVS